MRRSHFRRGSIRQNQRRRGHDAFKVLKREGAVGEESVSELTAPGELGC